MGKEENIKSIETCFSPALFPHLLTKDNFVVVIVDILRATTAICTAFKNGATEVLPVAKIEDTKKYRPLGYMIAGERDGIVIEGADFGNSPFNFSEKNVKGKKIVITTTNGTQTIEHAKISDSVVVGAFSNITVLSEWLQKQNKNVVIFCAGWKNKFNLEDSIMAGALAEILMKNGFCSHCDSTMAAMELWDVAKKDILKFIEKASHRHRLKKLGLDDVLEYCFTPDTANVLPFLKGDAFVDILKRT
jgi:2-phosphosulfolactate phosphatase